MSQDSRDIRRDWREYAAAAIPSKPEHTYLDHFLAGHGPLDPAGRRRTLLDMGCGRGEISRRFYERGYSVVGVDINAEAMATVRGEEPAGPSTHFLRYQQVDITQKAPPRLAEAPFDLIVCQLVISVIGGLAERQQLLSNAHALLRTGGHLYLSASGVSDTINPAYAELYARDETLTGEPYTYFSRDNAGHILYQTHHFSPAELTNLLSEAGFQTIQLDDVLEKSSRRPDQAAYFLYISATKS